MKVSYNYSKVLQHINRLERQINQIRGFSKKMSKNAENSKQQINKIMKTKAQITQKIKQTNFKKQLDNIDYLLVQEEQAQTNILWIQGYLQNWIDVSKQLPNKLQEQAKALESKRLNKNLKQQDIVAFKAELLSKTIQHNKSMKNILLTIGQWNVKNCCGLIQNLTTIMQKMRSDEKKKQRNSTPNSE